MAIDDEICLDDFDDFDKLQNEYECLFDDFEKLRHRDYKKIITTLTLDMENAKHKYDVVIDSKKELEKYLDALNSENEALKLELKEKCKALDICLDENVTLKFLLVRKKSILIICMPIETLERSMHILLAMNVVEKVTLLFIVFIRKNILPSRKFGFLKVPIF